MCIIDGGFLLDREANMICTPQVEVKEADDAGLVNDEDQTRGHKIA